MSQDLMTCQIASNSGELSCSSVGFGIAPTALARVRSAIVVLFRDGGRDEYLHSPPLLAILVSGLWVPEHKRAMHIGWCGGRADPASACAFSTFKPVTVA